jgi:XrtJ-associated TM-motif-TM protein
MKKQTALLFALIVMLPVMAHAQTGCLDSPENPTVVLGLVGSAAGALVYLRGRIFRAKKRN